jgi:preprotein translocase subunit SecD
MKHPYRFLLPIILIVLTAVYIDLPNSPGIHIGGIDRDFTTRLGLDLQGGVQALLEADVPPAQPIDPNDMSIAEKIVENRVNSLGVSEAVIQPAGLRRIVVELPGETDPAAALANIKKTGLLEFVDMAALSDQEAAALLHTRIATDWMPGTDQVSQSTSATQTETPLAESSTTTISATIPTITEQQFHTVMTGVVIKNVGVDYRQGGGYVVAFKLNSEGAQIFKDFTSSHIGKILGIVLDKELISIPSINSAITQGEGVIEGRFTNDSANQLADLLRYGSLPIPLKVVTSETIGPTLGQDSLQKSLVAGLIGMGAVMLFMLVSIACLG